MKKYIKKVVFWGVWDGAQRKTKGMRIIDFSSVGMKSGSLKKRLEREEFSEGGK